MLHVRKVWCIVHTNLIFITFISVTNEYINQSVHKLLHAEAMEAAIAPLQSSIDLAINKVASDTGFILKSEQKISVVTPSQFS